MINYVLTVPPNGRFQIFGLPSFRLSLPKNGSRAVFSGRGERFRRAAELLGYTNVTTLPILGDEPYSDTHYRGNTGELLDIFRLAEQPLVVLADAELTTYLDGGPEPSVESVFRVEASPGGFYGFTCVARGRPKPVAPRRTASR